MIKVFLTTILLWSVAAASAANYYFSSSSGNDSYTSTQAQNPRTPWASLAKFNALGNAFFKPGDSVFFKCGDTFSGSLVVRIKRSVSNTNPFVISSYGSGPKPVITTMFPIKAWTSLGGNKYRSKEPLPASSFNDGLMAMCVLNGKQQWPGSFPDYNPSNPVGLSIRTPDKAALSLDECNKQQTGIDWTGARATVRINPYVLERVRITGHEGNVLFNSGTSGKPAEGNSAWITHDPRTLTTAGEWCYDSTTKKVDIYLTKQPASYNIEFPTEDIAIDAKGCSYIHINGITVRGANRYGIYLYGAHNAVVQNCDVSFCGSTAVHASTTNLQSPKILNCNLWDVGLTAVDVRGAKDFVVEGNDIRRVAIYATLGGNIKGNELTAVYGNQSANTANRMANNRVDSCGYNGLRFYGSRNLIECNLIMNTGLLLGDGGAIYCRGSVSTAFTGNRITKNILLHARSGSRGVAKGGDNELIYLDDNITGVEVDSNFAAWSSNSVFYAHNAQNLNIHDNTFFGADGQVVQMKNDKGSATSRAMRAISFRNNLIIAKGDEYLYKLYTNSTDSSDFRLFDKDPDGSFGRNNNSTWKDNQLWQPALQKPRQFLLVYAYYNNPVSRPIQQTLQQVQKTFGLDLETTITAAKILQQKEPDAMYKVVYNFSGKDSTIVLQQPYINLHSGALLKPRRALVIKPHSGMVLLNATASISAFKQPEQSSTIATN